MAQSNNVTQTAGRNSLGEFAPKFAEYNDDILFGQVWNDPTFNLHVPFDDHHLHTGRKGHHRARRSSIILPKVKRTA